MQEKHKLRILFLSKLLPRANIIGGPILIYHRIKNLHLKGHKITVLAPCYTEEDKKDKSLEQFCEEVIKISSTKRRTSTKIKELHKKLRRPRFFFTGDGAYNEKIEHAFREILKRRYFDAIIAEYSMMGQYIEANMKAIPSKTLKVISVHECYTKALELRKQKGEKISEGTIKELRDYEFKMYSAADLILTLTPEDAKILVNYNPSLCKRIEVVPHGVDTSFYIPPKVKTWERNTKNILFVGNFQHYPNVDAVKNFIDKCWDKILREVKNAKFYAVGFNPPKELLKLKKKQIFVQSGGSNENIRRFYWNSDVFVAPIELGTGFRGKILEAMACALPIVATSLATYGIKAEHGKNMFIADNYETFSNYVIKLLKDANLRYKIGKNAYTLAKKFDHKYAAKKLEQVLKKAIAQKK